MHLRIRTHHASVRTHHMRTCDLADGSSSVVVVVLVLQSAVDEDRVKVDHDDAIVTFLQSNKTTDFDCFHSQ